MAGVLLLLPPPGLKPPSPRCTHFPNNPQLEHILLRPDTYIGSTEAQEQQLWVHDGERMAFKNIRFVPGLYKIFDEILVNGADNKVRDPTMDTLRVDIDPVGGCCWTVVTVLVWAAGRVGCWSEGQGWGCSRHAHS